MNTILIIIPEVIPKPKFDLVDSEGNERELTEDEVCQIEDYSDRKTNYEDVSHILNTWPINGDWERVIDDHGPIVVKGEQRYHCYTLPVERIDREDVNDFLDQQDLALTELNIETAYVEESTKEWLETNGYEQVVVEEGE